MISSVADLTISQEFILGVKSKFTGKLKGITKVRVTIMARMKIPVVMTTVVGEIIAGKIYEFQEVIGDPHYQREKQKRQEPLELRKIVWVLVLEAAVQPRNQVSNQAAWNTW